MSGSTYSTVLRRMVEAGRVAVASCTGTGVYAKISYDGVPDADMVTDLDKAVQAALEQARRLYMPESGVLAEEDGLQIECRWPNVGPWYAYWTFDGVDGTRRLVDCWQHRVQ